MKGTVPLGVTSSTQTVAAAHQLNQLDWERDSATWPHATESRFLKAGGVDWHVQVMGSGPALLLLHGTGASTHSWRDLMPILAQQFTLIVPDLPGHAFTRLDAGLRMSMSDMATAVAALTAALKLAPELVVGHSAGAALGVRLALEGLITPRSIVSINGSLVPSRDVPHQLFSPLVGLMARVPGVSSQIAKRAGGVDGVKRLLAKTGSALDRQGHEFYARLFASPEHVRGVLSMMAHWNLRAFTRALPALQIPLRQIVGCNDEMVRSADAYRVQQLVVSADITEVQNGGHLVHEEHPEKIARLLIDIGYDTGVLTHVARAP